MMASSYLVAVMAASLCVAVAGQRQLLADQPSWKCGVSGACAITCGFEGESCCGPDGFKTGIVCPAKGCNPVHGFLNAPKVIDADVNSHYYNGGPNHPPPVTSAAECCAQCRKNKKCNVWTYCSKAGGCGGKGACTAFTKRAEKENPRAFREFGTYCTADGRFPQLRCILRQAENADKAPLIQSGKDYPEIAWTSGRLPTRKF